MTETQAQIQTKNDFYLLTCLTKSLDNHHNVIKSSINSKLHLIASTIVLQSKIFKTDRVLEYIVKQIRLKQSDKKKIIIVVVDTHGYKKIIEEKDVL